MSQTKLVLGLDLGVTSVGWALIKTACGDEMRTLRDDDGQISDTKFEAVGVRIFPATTEDKTNAPKNHKRRTSRGQRRLVTLKAKNNLTLT